MMQQAETKPSILQSNQEISEDELVTYWTLTPPDVDFVLNILIEKPPHSYAMPAQMFLLNCLCLAAQKMCFTGHGTALI